MMKCNEKFQRRFGYVSMFSFKGFEELLNARSQVSFPEAVRIFGQAFEACGGFARGFK
jgi:hypothetical protein